MTNFEIADTDTDMKVFEIADMDMKVFESADTDMIFFEKSRTRTRGGQAADTRVHRSLGVDRIVN